MASRSLRFGGGRRSLRGCRAVGVHLYDHGTVHVTLRRSRHRLRDSFPRLCVSGIVTAECENGGRTAGLPRPFDGTVISGSSLTSAAVAPTYGSTGEDVARPPCRSIRARTLPARLSGEPA